MELLVYLINYWLTKSYCYNEQACNRIREFRGNQEIHVLIMESLGKAKVTKDILGRIKEKYFTGKNDFSQETKVTIIK